MLRMETRRITENKNKCKTFPVDIYRESQGGQRKDGGKHSQENASMREKKIIPGKRLKSSEGNTCSGRKKVGIFF